MGTLTRNELIINLFPVFMAQPELIFALVSKLVSNRRGSFVTYSYLESSYYLIGRFVRTSGKEKTKEWTRRLDLMSAVSILIIG